MPLQVGIHVTVQATREGMCDICFDGIWSLPPHLKPTLQLSTRDIVLRGGPLLVSLDCSGSLKTRAGNKTAAPSPGGSCLGGPRAFRQRSCLQHRTMCCKNVMLEVFYKTHSSVAASIKPHNCSLSFSLSLFSTAGSHLSFLFLGERYLFAKSLFITLKPRRRKDIMKGRALK